MHSLSTVLRTASILATLAAVASAAGSLAAEDPPATAPASEPAAGTSAETPESELTGEDIYARVLENRFYSYAQDIVMESGDRAKNTQKTELQMKYLSFRDTPDEDRFLSKTIAKYHAPQDVRHLGYLVIKKGDGSEDQFIYRPSARRVRRINLRGEAVFGTDFSLEDVLPREIEEATYRRTEDEVIGDTSVFVVEVSPKPEQDSEYSKFVVWVEKEHYVTLRTRYWDEYDDLFKELNASESTIQRFEGVTRDGSEKQIWVPTESKMSQLKTGSYTNLWVTKLKLDAKLREKDFSQRKLTASR